MNDDICYNLKLLIKLNTCNHLFLKKKKKKKFATIYNEDYIIHTFFFIILFYEPNYDDV